MMMLWLLLGSTSDCRLTVNAAVVQNGPLVSEQHATTLCAPFTDAEVKSAIHSIPGNKSPGPDGFNSDFFKASWEVVGGDVTDAILQFFKSGKILKEINTTPLFVICMEYLSRLLSDVAHREGFNFHSKCASLGLNHLIFVDDLLLFCKGDHSSIMLVLRALATFSASTV